MMETSSISISQVTEPLNAIRLIQQFPDEWNFPSDRRRSRLYSRQMSMTSQAKLIAVIGAGANGLATIKCLKEEGFYVVCYEKTEHIGGIWQYRNNDIEGVGSVMKSTVCNVSKELMAFSDFPPPQDYPNFMPHKLVLRYLEKYSEAFDLRRHVKLRHEVVRILPTSDNYRTGRWEVTIRDHIKHRTLVEVFDCVAVCVGRFGFPKHPQIPSLEVFQGLVVHTHNIKQLDAFRDLKVLVIGAGNSGADAAAYLSTVAEQVYLSTRHGTWVMQKPGPDGLPLDLRLCRRILNSVAGFLPKRLVAWYLERRINRKLNHSIFHLKPPYRFLTRRPTINDHLLSLILSGTIILKSGVKHFAEKGVVFQGDLDVVKVDAVVMATGYQLKISFLNDLIFQVIGDHVPLYKHVFPPHLNVPSMAIIGMVQVFGSVIPVGEMQARWFAHVLSKKTPFPDKGDIINDITMIAEREAQMYHPSGRNCMQVQFIPYMDEIASLIGAKPNFSRMFFQDPKLFWACINGPCLSYQYRLNGPHEWNGSREALLSYKRRVLAPLKTRQEHRQSLPGT